jgi:hypothetical protein
VLAPEGLRRAVEYVVAAYQMKENYRSRFVADSRLRTCGAISCQFAFFRAHEDFSLRPRLTDL